MIRFLLSFSIFLFSFFFETSFLSSLPFIFSFTPFVFAFGVYLLQHQGFVDGFVWILIYGFFLQVLHLSTSPLPIMSFFIGAVIGLFSARHLFSNRSLYGVVACALTGYLMIIFTEFIIVFSSSLIGPVDPVWSSFFLSHVYRVIMLVVVIIILYLLARPIHLLLRSSS